MDLEKYKPEKVSAHRFHCLSSSEVSSFQMRTKVEKQDKGTRARQQV